MLECAFIDRNWQTTLQTERLVLLSDSLRSEVSLSPLSRSFLFIFIICSHI
uniref:Uncharacterized protein n=1 Tax=Parascaris equorum TaxID=6256 RepID=A0A914S1U4_PAREQ